MADSGTLLQIAIPIASFALGFGGALFMQDRLHLRRLRSLVAVLQAEAHRLRTELGGSDTQWYEISWGGTVPAIPTIHPWIQNSIVELGGSDPEVLTLFLDLDRRLRNQSIFLDNLRRARSSPPTHEDLGPKPEEPVDDAGIEALGKYFGELIRRETRERVAKADDARHHEFVEELRERVNSAHAAIVVALKKLQHALSRFDARLSGHPVLAIEPVEAPAVNANESH